VINSESSENFPRSSVWNSIAIGAASFFGAVNEPCRVCRKYLLPAVKGTGPCTSIFDTRDCWVIGYGVVSSFILIWPCCTPSDPKKIPIVSVRCLFVRLATFEWM
jgi:hypothetical protein